MVYFIRTVRVNLAVGHKCFSVSGSVDLKRSRQANKKLRQVTRHYWYFVFLFEFYHHLFRICTESRAWSVQYFCRAEKFRKLSLVLEKEWRFVQAAWSCLSPYQLGSFLLFSQLTFSHWSLLLENKGLVVNINTHTHEIIKVFLVFSLI